MGYIYKIENQITHKQYIGKTLFTIQRRWNQHKYNSTVDVLQRYSLYRDMRKYGIENFTIEQVEKVDDPFELSDREIYWIAFFDTYYNGYNNTLGGDGGILHDYNTIWELWQQGYKIKEISDIMDCYDQVVRTVLDNHHVSTEERLERSYNDQIASHEPYCRKVEKVDIETKEVLEIFNSVSEAAQSIKMDSSSLSKICKKNGITHGFMWRYANDKYQKKDFSAKRVGKVDLKTKQVIEEFPSTLAAAKSVDGDSSYISKVCRGIQKSSKGFGWIFLDNN